MSNKPSVSIYGDISVDEVINALKQVYPDKILRINQDKNKDNALIHPTKIGYYNILYNILLNLILSLLFI